MLRRLIAALGVLTAACGSTGPSGPSKPQPVQLTAPQQARETCDGIGYSAPASELPEATSVKLYAFLLQCDCRRALAVGEVPGYCEPMLKFSPLPEDGAR